MTDNTGALVDRLFDEAMSSQTVVDTGPNRGRKAALTRAEAKAVKEDMRPYWQIAESYGISKETIMRVKRTGRYKDIPYIPSDVDPREYGLKPRMSDYPRPSSGRRGRPLRTGRPPLNDDEYAALLADLRAPELVALEFNVPVDYVRRQRKKHKIAAGREALLSEDIKVLIAIDKRPNWMLAREYKCPEFIIERIKEKYSHLIEPEVTSGGNDVDV
jgi:hypothetical protein